MSPISHSKILAAILSSFSARLIAPLVPCRPFCSILRNSSLMNTKRRWIFFLRRKCQVVESLTPRNRSRQQVSKTVDVREPIAPCFPHNVRGLFAVSEGLHAAQKRFSHRDDCLVADAEMLSTTVKDRPHAFGGAGVMVEKILDTRKVDRLLHLSILQIIVARM